MYLVNICRTFEIEGGVGERQVENQFTTKKIPTWEFFRRRIFKRLKFHFMRRQ